MTGPGGKSKHAFLGLGFRERPQAYDFQAALFDHVKYPLELRGFSVYYFN